MRSPTPAGSAAEPDPTADLREQLTARRSALLEQRRFRIEQLAGLRTAVPADPAQEEIVRTLRTGASIALAGIESALDRMAHGTYGLCVHCGAPIPPERLEILPAVALCMTCQRAETPGAE